MLRKAPVSKNTSEDLAVKVTSPFIIISVRKYTRTLRPSDPQTRTLRPGPSDLDPSRGSCLAYLYLALNVLFTVVGANIKA